MSAIGFYCRSFYTVWITRLCGSVKEFKVAFKVIYFFLNSRSDCSVYSFDASLGDSGFLSENETLLKQADEVLAFWLAGSLGTLVRIPDLQDIAPTLNLNITVPIIQTRVLLNILDSKTVLKIINFSSLAALEPFDCWSLYCTGKSARDAFFKCLAHESDMGSRTVRVLNYAPGPCITRMKDQILNTMPKVPLKSSMEKISWIPVKDSIRVLLKVLEMGQFENGAHVDYYDVQNPG